MPVSPRFPGNQGQEAEAPPLDRWDQTRQLIELAFHADDDVASLASKELLARLNLPAIRLSHEDGRRKIIRREVAP